MFQRNAAFLILSSGSRLDHGLMSPDPSTRDGKSGGREMCSRPISGKDAGSAALRRFNSFWQGQPIEGLLEIIEDLHAEAAVICRQLKQLRLGAGGLWTEQQCHPAPVQGRMLLEDLDQVPDLGRAERAAGNRLAKVEKNLSRFVRLTSHCLL